MVKGIILFIPSTSDVGWQIRQNMTRVSSTCHQFHGNLFHQPVGFLCWCGCVFVVVFLLWCFLWWCFLWWWIDPCWKSYVQLTSCTWRPFARPLRHQWKSLAGCVAMCVIITTKNTITTACVVCVVCVCVYVCMCMCVCVSVYVWVRVFVFLCMCVLVCVLFVVLCCVVVFLWWRLSGGVCVVVVFLSWRLSGGVCVVVLFLCLCGGVFFCGGVLLYRITEKLCKERWQYWCNKIFGTKVLLTLLISTITSNISFIQLPSFNCLQCFRDIRRLVFSILRNIISLPNTIYLPNSYNQSPYITKLNPIASHSHRSRNHITSPPNQPTHFTSPPN